MVKLVTDSGANLPPALARQLDVTVVPLSVIFGEDSYREGVEITDEQFYSLLRNSPELPRTSQPSPHDFADVYRRLLDAGHEVLCITLSKDLSGTYNSAVQGAAMFENAPITVVDSRFVSAGQALLVIAAARALELGATRQQAAAFVEALIPQVMLLFTLDTLEYLRRGGRIGGASALLGTMLRIKPVLQITDGHVEPFDRVRRRQRALERMAEAARDRFGDQPVWVGLAHAEAEEDFRMLRDLVTGQLNVDYLLETKVGPVVGTHGGPGVVGMAVMPAPDFSQLRA